MVGQLDRGWFWFINSAVSEIQAWMSRELFFPSRVFSLTFVLSAASKETDQGPVVLVKVG